MGDSRTDHQLIDAMNLGETGAFDALYTRYRDWVVALAQRFTGNPADALDAMQETFAYLLGKFPGFQLTAAMKTFLYPVVRHNAIRALQKRRRHAPGDDPLADLPAPPRVDSASRRELAEAVSMLDESRREVLLMRFVDDMSLDEIAQALGVPLGTVKSRLHYALKALREDARTKRYFGAE